MHQFTSGDLENISGVKAATIRIWEKRYGLFNPTKALRNIRYYDSRNMQKLLNVALLNKYGYKISRIATMSDEGIRLTARELVFRDAINDRAITDLKLAMYQFDQELFEKVYLDLLKEHSFEEVFIEVFVPFLNFIGLLWQTESIQPVHEHFVANLIAQKILIETAGIKHSVSSDEVYVLFLPENEIHQLGLLFANYMLRKKGFKTVYLGESVPLDNLKSIIPLFSEISFLTYFTMLTEKKSLESYLRDVEYVLENTAHRLIAIGAATENIEQNVFKRTSCYSSLKQLFTI
jgi:methanogenic corrinoid protein MtbC1